MGMFMCASKHHFCHTLACALNQTPHPSYLLAIAHRIMSGKVKRSTLCAFPFPYFAGGGTVAVPCTGSTIPYRCDCDAGSATEVAVSATFASLEGTSDGYANVGWSVTNIYNNQYASFKDYEKTDSDSNSLGADFGTFYYNGSATVISSLQCTAWPCSECTSCSMATSVAGAVIVAYKPRVRIIIA